MAPFLSLSKSLWGIVALHLDIRAFLQNLFQPYHSENQVFHVFFCPEDIVLQKTFFNLIIVKTRKLHRRGTYDCWKKRRETTQEEDDDEVEEDVTIPEVINALKIVRKFSQKKIILSRK